MLVQPACACSRRINEYCPRASSGSNAQTTHFRRLFPRCFVRFRVVWGVCYVINRCFFSDTIRALLRGVGATQTRYEPVPMTATVEYKPARRVYRLCGMESRFRYFVIVGPWT